MSTHDDAHEAARRYPLSWPAGWKRTPPGKRQLGSFTQTKSDLVGTGESAQWQKRSVAVSTLVATKRLEAQLERLGGVDPTLSTNVKLRMDGRPYSNEEPADPGVAVYFRFKGRATVLACDRYTRVASNIAAIAQHVDALRRIDRYGVGTLEQALAGYRSLPADTAADWRHVFGFTATEPVTVERMNDAFKKRAAVSHPDKGGTDVEMAHINRAREYAMQDLLG